MAEVWEATDDILGRRVAVKILLPHLASDESFLERFRREAIAAARLTHPNVVGTFDTGSDNGVAYIVMELVDGHTLDEVLARHGSLRPERAVHIAAQVAAALDYAHHHGIVHRDVKPGNILICDDDRVKVADFGIAKAAVRPDGERPSAAVDLTQSGAVVGTAKYLSPEQVNGDAVDGRADIYALGVVLYEMLCGRPPFVGETDVAVALQHASAAPLSPRQLRPGIPRPLEGVVLRCLAKSPNDRYPNAAALQSALLAIDVHPDDAVPLVVRDPTPPGGTRVAPRPGPGRRSSPKSLGLLGVVVVSLAILVVLFATTEAGRRVLSGDLPGGGSAQPRVISDALAFDPQGSGVEHDDELPHLHDGDPATVWTTETYSTSRFGGLKEGVGVVLVLDAPGPLRNLAVTSPSTGWSAEVFVADTPKSGLAEWGQPVSTKNGIGGRSATFPLRDREGAAVLLWITDLGPVNQVRVAEVEVTAA